MFLSIAVMIVVVGLRVMVRIVFRVFSIFCITSFGDCIRPRNYLFFNWKKIRLTSYVTFRLDCKRIVGNFG